MVPALYEWLNKKQRETPRGRAELRLAEYANLWGAKPTAKFAPSYLDWLNIRRLVSPLGWNQTEREMMAMAGRRHIIATFLTILVVGAITFSAFQWQKRTYANSLVSQLQTSQTSQLPMLLDSLDSERAYANSALEMALRGSEPDSRTELVNRLALVSANPSLAKGQETQDWLFDQLMTQPVPMVLVIRDRLGNGQQTIVDRCQSCLLDSSQTDDRRLRAAIVVAKYRSSEKASEVWDNHAELVVRSMLKHLSSFPHEYAPLTAAFFNEREMFEKPLADICLSSEANTNRAYATNILIDYFKEDPERLLPYALDASDQQHPAFVRSLDEHLPKLSAVLTEHAFQEIDTRLAVEDFDRCANRKATAASLLHRIGMGSPTWRLLEESTHPNARTYFVYRAPRLGCQFDKVLKQLKSESDPVVVSHLMIMLHQFDWDQIPSSVRQDTIEQLRQFFGNHPDRRIHSSAQWLLRQVDDGEWVDAAIERMVSDRPKAGFDWYVNSQRQTMAIFDARDVPEIGYVFEFATMEVSVDQFLKYSPSHQYYEHRSPTFDCPVGLVDWFEATEYCRWISEQEGMEPKDSYPSDMSPSEDYTLDHVVAGSNYRLPTKEEWGYVCHANLQTPRYFGWNESLVGEYCFYWENSVDGRTGEVRYYPSDTKPPNPAGVFAMYDGIREWGHSASDDRVRRYLFGKGNNQDVKQSIFSEMIGRDLPNSRNGFYGMRLARTVVDPQ